ncbi:MAG: hypothetical protein HKN72_09515 [Gemmatimonadetes bacterium]|nr:hypothetical protein [Gemmatimonadota bacterium]NNF13451.1 hypothetical protein [Gemmatimonadota bacterium]
MSSVVPDTQDGIEVGQGAVYDLGYRPHDGDRLGRSGAFRAMIVDGTRRALGLRRKHLAKIIPWGLIAAAIVPAVWIMGLTYVVAGFGLEDTGPWGDPAEFFEYIGLLTLLFVALTAPALLIPDREHGVLAIYASRPVRAADYLLARAATLLGLTTLFMLIPQAILYVGISGLYFDGMLAGLIENGSNLPATLGTLAAFVLGFGGPAFLVALFAKRFVIASGVYVMIMMLSLMMAETMPRATELLVFKLIAPLSLMGHPYSVRDWLFDQEPEGWALDRVGLPPWVGAATIVGVVVAVAFLAHRRYRREF